MKRISKIPPKYLNASSQTLHVIGFSGQYFMSHIVSVRLISHCSQNQHASFIGQNESREGEEEEEEVHFF
jgi:hypothetical protein